MKAIKNIIFDFGSVLVDWNPHYLFDSYFGSVEKADYFLENICNRRLNERTDGGEAFADQGECPRHRPVPQMVKVVQDQNVLFGVG